MANDRSLERLEQLEDQAIDVLEQGLRENGIEYQHRLKAAQDVLNRRRIQVDVPISRDEAVERLKDVIGGLATAFFGSAQANGTVEELLQTMEAECEEKTRGQEYKGKVNVKALTEREKYKE